MKKLLFFLFAAYLSSSFAQQDVRAEFGISENVGVVNVKLLYIPDYFADGESYLDEFGKIYFVFLSRERAILELKNKSFLFRKSLVELKDMADLSTFPKELYIISKDYDQIDKSLINSDNAKNNVFKQEIINFDLLNEVELLVTQKK